MQKANNQKEIVSDPAAAARAAGLRYVSDARPGITRNRQGKGFRYTGVDGTIVRDRAVLGRIKSLAIPPAWKEVWISESPNGHIQATGRDARGRKQYRYHPKWRSARDETKYHRMVAFGKTLTAIRKRVDRDLKRTGLPREKLLAAVVRLLETTLIRVGNEEYARSNKSFGLTTMRDKHVKVVGTKIHFEFRGKSGVKHSVDLHDQQLAKIIRRCQDLPGQDLFQYLDDDGVPQSIESGDVNEYLREIAGDEFTAKDFRTWAGTILAAMALQEFKQFDSKTEAKRNVVRAIETVASQLGNTPAVCKKCYIHPTVIELYLEGGLVETLQQAAERKLREELPRLRKEEAAVLAILQQRLHQEATRKKAA